MTEYEESDVKSNRNLMEVTEDSSLMNDNKILRFYKNTKKNITITRISCVEHCSRVFRSTLIRIHFLRQTRIDRYELQEQWVW